MFLASHLTTTCGERPSYLVCKIHFHPPGPIIDHNFHSAGYIGVIGGASQNNRVCGFQVLFGHFTDPLDRRDRTGHSLDSFRHCLCHSFGIPRQGVVGYQNVSRLLFNFCDSPPGRAVFSQHQIFILNEAHTRCIRFIAFFACLYSGRLFYSYAVTECSRRRLHRYVIAYYLSPVHGVRGDLLIMPGSKQNRPRHDDTRSGILLVRSPRPRVRNYLAGLVIVHLLSEIEYIGVLSANGEKVPRYLLHLSIHFFPFLHDSRMYIANLLCFIQDGNNYFFRVTFQHQLMTGLQNKEPSPADRRERAVLLTEKVGPFLALLGAQVSSCSRHLLDLNDVAFRGDLNFVLFCAQTYVHVILARVLPFNLLFNSYDLALWKGLLNSFSYDRWQLRL
ncbi:hypothetical protein ES703_45598 [subsurface metagenome]